MLVLGGACVLLGIAPLIALRPASRVVAQLLKASSVAAGGSLPLVPPGTIAIGTLAALLAALVAVAATLRAALARGRAPARAPTWGCAYPRPTPRMQYTASSFGAPLLAAFGSPIAPPAVRTPDGFATSPEDRVLTRVLHPVWIRLRSVAAALRTLQQGRVTTYLQYIVFTLVLLLGVLFLSARRP
jgi:hydrogenase-4 component B